MVGEDSPRELWPRRLCATGGGPVFLDDRDLTFLRTLRIATDDLPQYTVVELPDRQLAMIGQGSVPLQCAMLWDAARKHEQQYELLGPRSYEHALDHLYARLLRDETRRITVEYEYGWLHNRSPGFVPPRRIEALYQTLCPQQYLRSIGVIL